MMNFEGNVTILSSLSNEKKKKCVSLCINSKSFQRRMNMYHAIYYFPLKNCISDICPRSRKVMHAQGKIYIVTCNR